MTRQHGVQRPSTSGFTLLEVLVSLAVFSIASAAFANAFLTHLMMNNRSERRSEAIAAAQQILDEIRTEDPTSLPTTGSATPIDITMGPRTYTVTVDYCLDPSICVTNNLRHLHVEVSYRNDVIYEVDTVYAQLR